MQAVFQIRYAESVKISEKDTAKLPPATKKVLAEDIEDAIARLREVHLGEDRTVKSGIQGVAPKVGTVVAIEIISASKTTDIDF